MTMMTTTSAPLKLYYAAGSCALAPHIVLEELGVPYEPVRLSFKDGEQLAPAYRAINPRARVPALLVGEQVLLETVAVLHYLATAYPRAGLWPAEVLAQGRCLSTMAFLASSVHIDFSMLWRPERLSDDKAAQATIVDKGRALAQEHFAELDAALQAGPYLMGGQYTVADPYLLVFYRWGNRIKLPMRERFPSWTRHTEALLQRPAVQRALKAQEISVF